MYFNTQKVENQTWNPVIINSIEDIYIIFSSNIEIRIITIMNFKIYPQFLGQSRFSNLDLIAIVSSN